MLWKIYCKHINEYVSEIWAYFGISLWSFPLRTEAAVSGELSPVDNSTQQKSAHEELALGELGPATVWQGHDPPGGMELLRVISFS